MDNAILHGARVFTLSGKLRLQIRPCPARKVVAAPFQEMHKSVLSAQPVGTLELDDIDARDFSEYGEIAHELLARLLGMNILRVYAIPVGRSLGSGEIDGKRRHGYLLGGRLMT